MRIVLSTLKQIIKQEEKFLDYPEAMFEWLYDISPEFEVLGELFKGSGYEVEVSTDIWGSRSYRPKGFKKQSRKRTTRKRKE